MLSVSQRKILEIIEVYIRDYDAAFKFLKEVLIDIEVLDDANLEVQDLFTILVDALRGFHKNAP